jgi:hypothetical protein
MEDNMAMRDYDSLKTHEVIERLAAKYASPSYGFLTQVRNGTGMRADRTADAMAMSLWPSRGLHVLGFEVKVSRTDWLKEYKDPEKAEAIAQYCHYWYLVCGSTKIILPGELPKTWRLIVPKGAGLKIEKEAEFNQKALPPDYDILAGIFRNVAERCIPKEVIKSKLEAEFEQGKTWAKSENDRLKENLRELREAISVFEKASGVLINSWPSGNENIGAAVRKVLDGKDKKGAEMILKLTERAENIVKFLKGEKVDTWDC